MPRRHRLDCFVFCDRSVFLEQARLEPFSDDNTIDENPRDFVHLGKWSDRRRIALVTSEESC